MLYAPLAAYNLYLPKIHQNEPHNKKKTNSNEIFHATKLKNKKKTKKKKTWKTDKQIATAWVDVVGEGGREGGVGGAAACDQAWSDMVLQ